MKPCIIYIMGVSGSGKTTIGKKLSEKMNIPFFDGDDFHSEANKEKMKSGHPLNDRDRAGWLTSIDEFAKKKMQATGAIIGCSALKEKYRRILSAGITVPLRWIFLQGSFELIKKRMEERSGHYMKPKMLSSQFDILEVPPYAIQIDISKTPDEIVEEIISRIQE